MTWNHSPRCSDVRDRGPCDAPNRSSEFHQDAKEECSATRGIRRILTADDGVGCPHELLDKFRAVVYLARHARDVVNDTGFLGPWSQGHHTWLAQDGIPSVAAADVPEVPSYIGGDTVGLDHTRKQATTGKFSVPDVREEPDGSLKRVSQDRPRETHVSMGLRASGQDHVVLCGRWHDVEVRKEGEAR